LEARVFVPIGAAYPTPQLYSLYVGQNGVAAHHERPAGEGETRLLKFAGATF
jgi:hypothetical protein